MSAASKTMSGAIIGNGDGGVVDGGFGDADDWYDPV